ncbi:MAG: endonuclease [Candidatus Omnitrophica bacterium]|nr:endonuclease [Candidatus Omnitrophota bacterium]
MDTKLTADIAESAVTTELLKRGFRVLQPIGDRLAYDLAVERDGYLLRLQVKSAWFNAKDKSYIVDSRRTKTNRRRMLRQRYGERDFDFAIIYLADVHVFYVMPLSVFSNYESTITFVETEKRQRRPKSAMYREQWDLLSNGLLGRRRPKDSLSNSVKPLTSRSQR